MVMKEGICVHCGKTFSCDWEFYFGKEREMCGKCVRQLKGWLPIIKKHSKSEQNQDTPTKEKVEEVSYKIENTKQ
jgi:hypothetical protein